MASLPVVPIICGPTGSGKTGVALKVAADFPVEIISADSCQMIKHLNIGTAKPTDEERQAVRFHLVDIIEPGERYSAFRFLEECDRIVGEILKRQHRPLVVGGTGLYLRAVSEGVIEIEPGDDLDHRAKLEADMAEFGPEEMHRRLEALDPVEAAKIHPNNKVRVIRTLEIHKLTGKSKTELVTTGAYKKSKYAYAYYCLQPERSQLYAAIDARVDAMMQAGLEQEVRRLVAQGLEAPLRRANVIGYEELLDYFDGHSSLEEAVLLIKQNSRQYAKRQMTWFRHQSDGQQYSDPARLESALAEALREGGAGG